MGVFVLLFVFAQFQPTIIEQRRYDRGAKSPFFPPWLLPRNFSKKGKAYEAWANQDSTRSFLYAHPKLRNKPLKELVGGMKKSWLPAGPLKPMVRVYRDDPWTV